MRYWTSDIHFGHHNVIDYCKRPYSNVYVMNESIKNNWNSILTPSDSMVFLGDWAMHPKFVFYLKYLNFSELDWVLGNHDKEGKIRKMFEEGGELYSLRDKVRFHKELYVDIDGFHFHCVHRPIQGSSVYPVICGHVHEKWRFLPAGSQISEHSKSKEAKDDVGKVKITKTPILNVGVDQHNFYPISDDEVLEYFK